MDLNCPQHRLLGCLVAAQCAVTGRYFPFPASAYGGEGLPAGVIASATSPGKNGTFGKKLPFGITGNRHL